VVVSYEEEPAWLKSCTPTRRTHKYMEFVDIKIGSLRFDQANYDGDSDVLYLHSGDPQSGEGEETPEGRVLRYAPGTSRVVGLTLVGARQTLERDGHVLITVPETIEATAEDLALAPR
jgi:uncharacterized protein YuzE